MGRGRQERLLKSLRLPLALLCSSSDSSFHSITCSTPRVPQPPPYPRPASFFLSLRLVLTLYGRTEIRPVIVPRCISGRTPRLLNNERVSQCNDTLPFYNSIQLSLLSDAQKLLRGAHTQPDGQARHSSSSHTHIGRGKLSQPQASSASHLSPPDPSPLHSPVPLPVRLPGSPPCPYAVLWVTLCHSNMKTSLWPCTQSN